jgi:7-dehydrocholesterol reductase
MVPSPFEPKAWKIIGTYAFVQAMIMRFVPGKKFIGPLTPKGNTPEYNANGV